MGILDKKFVEGFTERANEAMRVECPSYGENHFQSVEVEFILNLYLKEMSAKLQLLQGVKGAE